MRKLKTRLADHNSRLWRNKADKVWSQLVRINGECMVCGASASEFQLQAHHLIPREILHYRHIVENGVALCVRHHKFGMLLSAHKNPVAFLLWLKENRSAQWDWLVKTCASIDYPSPVGSYDFYKAWVENILKLPP